MAKEKPPRGVVFFLREELLCLVLGLLDAVELLVHLEQLFLGKGDIHHAHHGGQAQDRKAAHHLHHAIHAANSQAVLAPGESIDCCPTINSWGDNCCGNLEQISRPELCIRICPSFPTGSEALKGYGGM